MKKSRFILFLSVAFLFMLINTPMVLAAKCEDLWAQSSQHKISKEDLDALIIPRKRAQKYLMESSTSTRTKNFSNLGKQLGSGNFAFRGLFVRNSNEIASIIKNGIGKGHLLVFKREIWVTTDFTFAASYYATGETERYLYPSDYTGIPILIKMNPSIFDWEPGIKDGWIRKSIPAENILEIYAFNAAQKEYILIYRR